MLENLKDDVIRKINRLRGIEVEPEEEPIPEFKIDQNEAKCYILLIDHKGQDLIDLKQLADRVGCITTVSHTGLACMDRVVKDKYDIIFLAKDMPIMDGIQTLRNIRSSKASKCRDAAIYALLELDDETPELDLRREGFAGVLHMPVDEALFMQVISKHVVARAIPQDPRLRDPLEYRAKMADKLQHYGIVVADGLKACKGDMKEYQMKLQDFCNQYEDNRGKLSKYLFGKDADAYMSGAREVREAAKVIGARYLADLFDDHVNMSKDDSLDIAEGIWRKALLAWERVVSGVADYLGRTVELVVTGMEEEPTNGIRLSDQDVRAMVKDILDLLHDDEDIDAMVGMDRLMAYEMSETMRLKLIKANRSLNRGEMDAAIEVLSAIVLN
ncbi:MAG: hypothetical protein J6O53_04050 [Eubacterium sp.]|nr:hypothetical protein [Eubacterium sp.]